MSPIVKILLFMFSCVLTNNYIFSRFLGCCPFLGVSNKVETAFGMGLAVTFVMALASLFTYFVYYYVLIPLNLAYLNTIAFILVIASLVQVVEMFLKKSAPSLYSALGIYLPLITTNCAVLGVAQLNVTEGYNLILSVVNGVASALGYTLSICLFAGIRERLALNNMPKWMEGFTGAMITAGLMAVAFNGFSGLI